MMRFIFNENGACQAVDEKTAAEKKGKDGWHFTRYEAFKAKEAKEAAAKKTVKDAKKTVKEGENAHRG